MIQRILAFPNLMAAHIRTESAKYKLLSLEDTHKLDITIGLHASHH